MKKSWPVIAAACTVVSVVGPIVKWAVSDDWPSLGMVLLACLVIALILVIMWAGASRTTPKTLKALRNSGQYHWVIRAIVTDATTDQEASDGLVSESHPDLQYSDYAEIVPSVPPDLPIGELVVVGVGRAGLAILPHTGKAPAPYLELPWDQIVAFSPATGHFSAVSVPAVKVRGVHLTCWLMISEPFDKHDPQGAVNQTYLWAQRFNDSRPAWQHPG